MTWARFFEDYWCFAAGAVVGQMARVWWVYRDEKRRAAKGGDKP